MKLILNTRFNPISLNFKLFNNQQQSKQNIEILYCETQIQKHNKKQGTINPSKNIKEIYITK